MPIESGSGDYLFEKVGVIGLGQMGTGIARNLERVGLLSGVFDIRSDRVSGFYSEGSGSHPTFTELRNNSDALVFAVPSTEVIREFLPLANGRDWQVIVDVSTSDPITSKAISRSLAVEGVDYVDAAMTGGAAGADAGTLTLMVGGDARVLEVCRPVFDAISSSVFHLGPAGSGHAMKLVHNMILHSSFMALCEGLRLAERANIDVNQAVSVLNAGNARSYLTDTRFPRDILGGQMNTRSTVGNLEKDLKLAVALADRLGATAPVSNMTAAILDRAILDGYANSDFSLLYPHYEQIVEGMGEGID